jgi:PTS system ascorbate-specific IIA component
LNTTRVGILIIAHNDIGRQLLETAIDMLDRASPQLRSLEVKQDDDPVKLLTRARRLVSEIQQGAGVLVLTDMYGSTPSNIAHRLCERPAALNHEHEQNGNIGSYEATPAPARVRVIAGINLPMLVRALNYAHLSLDELAAKALSGGREGILDASQQNHE